jgi:EAL domain
VSQKAITRAGDHGKHADAQRRKGHANAEFVKAAWRASRNGRFFGTGYSSLSNLKKFPINTIKVDRSFIRDIPGNPEDVGITDAIITMGRTLSLTVVAEGVETKEQAEFPGDLAKLLREHEGIEAEQIAP